MPVIPADKDRRWVAAGQVFTRNAELPVGFRTCREQHLMVVGQGIGQPNIFAKGHVSEKAKAGPTGKFLVLSNDRFNFLMIRCHAASDQPIGSRQAVEQVNPSSNIFLLEQFANRVESSRSRAENSDAEGVCFRANLIRHAMPFSRRDTLFSPILFSCETRSLYREPRDPSTRREGPGFSRAKRGHLTNHLEQRPLSIFTLRP